MSVPFTTSVTLTHMGETLIITAPQTIREYGRVSCVGARGISLMTAIGALHAGGDRYDITPRKAEKLALLFAGGFHGDGRNRYYRKPGVIMECSEALRFCRSLTP